MTTVETEPSLEDRLAPHLPKFLAALAATGAGLGAYGYLRRQRLSADPALRAIQAASGGKYTHLLEGRAKEHSRLSRILDKILTAGGGNVAYADDLGAAKVKGALVHDAFSRARGDIDILHPSDSINLGKLFGGVDKAREAELFQKYAPGSVPETLRMSKIKAPIFGDRLKTYEEQLRQKFPRGYVLKTTGGAGTAGRFPTDAHDLAKVLEAGGHEAEVVKELLRSPSKVIAQEKIKIKPGNVLDHLWGALRGTPSTKEMRVHVFNGAVAPDLTLPRFSPFSSMSTAAQATEAENFVKDVINKLPRPMQKGTYSFDIAPVATGGYKIIEANPGYRSGFLRLGHNPMAGFQMHRTVTGRSSPLGAAIGAGVAGTGAGLAAYGLASTLSDQGEEHE